MTDDEPRVGELRLVLLDGEWTGGRVTEGGIVVIGDPNEWPRSLVEEWGPEVSVLPHPAALVPHPDMLAAPPIGDPAYDRALDCKIGEVRDLTHPKAAAVVDAAVAEGVALDWIIREAQARQRACDHRSTTLDRKRRLVRCNDCGAAVDVFDMVCSWAEGSRRGYHEIVERDSLERQIKNLRTEVEGLAADAKREKARAAAAKKARKNALRLSDTDLYELSLWRDLYDARVAHDFHEQKRLGVLLTKLQDQRREAEAAEQPEPAAPATPPVRLTGGPDG